MGPPVRSLRPRPGGPRVSEPVPRPSVTPVSSYLTTHLSSVSLVPPTRRPGSFPHPSSPWEALYFNSLRPTPVQVRHWWKDPPRSSETPGPFLTRQPLSILWP